MRSARRYEVDPDTRLVPKPTLTLVKLSRCEPCFRDAGIITPNRDGAALCPRCGAPFQISEVIDADVVITGAPFARLCLWIGGKLQKLHDWLEDK